MVSNTHEYDQIVVSKEITPPSCSKNTDDLNESDITETSSSKPDGDNREAIILANNNELSHIEREVTICDTCGDIGCEDLLVICCNCEVGAEHIYCMMEKVDKVPSNWSCYDCTERVAGMGEVERIEETNSRKRKAKSVINVFEIAEKKSPQSNCKIADFDLNVDLNIELDEGKDSNKNPVIDLNEDHDIDLNKNHGIDLNMDPNINISMGQNVNMSLGHASSFEAGSSSKSQAQYAKKPRIDTELFL